MTGIRPAIPDTVLIARARTALAEGPLDATTLLGHVLALPGAPPRVASRLARALLGDYPEFVCDATDRWTMREAPCDVAIVTPSALRGLRYAVVDVETTGSSARLGDRIVEIAIVPVDDGVAGEPFVSLVNPDRPMPPAIIALTRITQEMVRRAPRFPEVADSVSRHLAGRIFVAHNARFDWGFVCSEMARARGVELQGERLCTVRLTRALLPKLRRRNLDAIAHYFGIEITARHRAGGDAVATAQAFCRLLGVAADHGLDTWPALTERLARRTGRARRKRRALPHSMDFDPTL
jgi:DNA polymerase-3 subunit epsilon